MKQARCDPFGRVLAGAYLLATRITGVEPRPGFPEALTWTSGARAAVGGEAARGHAAPVASTAIRLVPRLVAAVADAVVGPAAGVFRVAAGLIARPAVAAAVVAAAIVLLPVGETAAVA